ncbi:nucleosome-remodeling factor subunit NURF301 isoform X3 [Aphis gossypii]|uniref:nucleosome-remodeling factor subunit NURF301 isoform X3 n=1 Tax=Aphis gossypii TaxID=80765 RepID=UPI0021597856|nr:nucleosome-remodeling factor subunit NURF301 isoform X3 [Aphis gossypii]
MSGRPKRRGRPPKTPGSDKPKFQMHLLKKPKYLQNLETVDVVQSPPPARTAASRRSAPASVGNRTAAVVETPSRNTRRSNQKPKTPKTPVAPKPRALRASTSKKKTTKKKTSVDKSHDYHYGSDFDESEKSEEPSESEQSDTNVEDAVDDVSDSDFSVSDFSVASRARKSNVSYIRNPSPEPLWLRGEEIPKLELPKSSEDLLVPTEHVMQALSVYEVLRRFKSQVRLSPFRFEDFCAALVYEEQSYLLAEIHIMLLKAILREEDLQQTHYGAVDQKDSINSVLYFMDTITWPEVLREYIESDKSFDPQVLKVFNSGDEYPFTNIKNRLSVLQFLTDQFLTSTLIREDFVHEGHSFQYDDHCRVCHKVGDLLCCETCPAVFHLECAEPPLHDVPTEDWQCNLCKEHKVIGVSDCIPDDEKSGLSSRQDHLAYDRHGRKYWFLVRRIFIENEETGECWYYTTEEQLGLLIDSLDREMESTLFNEIEKVKDEINRQMKITMDLTLQYRPSNRKTFLDIENSYIIGMREEMQKKKETEITKNDSNNSEDNTDNVKGDNESKKDGKQENSDDVSVDKNGICLENEDGNGDLKNDDNSMDVDDGEHNHSLRSTRNRSLRLKPAQVSQRQTPEQQKKVAVVEKPSPVNSYLDNLGTRLTRFKAQHIAAGTYLFKLGMDNSFKTYVNQYSTNPTALNKIQKNEERDKKRYMSHKFSLTGPGEFKWCGQIFGARSTLISTVKQTIISLDNLLPSSLMHINWSVLRKPWLNQVNSCSTPKDFARVMVVLMSCIKPVVYAPVWHEQLGHVKIYRITHAEREEKKKTDKKDKKDKDAEEDERNRLTIHFVKYTLGLKHQVHKQKGEEYRIHGQWGWQWLSKTRDYKLADSSKQGLAAGPAKRIFQGKDDKGVRTFSIAETLYDSIILKECTFDSEVSSEILNDKSVIHLDSVKDIDFINMKILSPIEKVDENINISSTLCSTSRIMYPKVAKKCKTDMLLPRRMQLKLAEERSILAKNTIAPKTVPEVENTKPSSASPQLKPETITKMREKSYMLSNLQKRVIQLKQHYLSFNTMSEHMICYNSSCRAANKSSMTASCYSPLCIRHVSVRNELLSLLRKMNILKSELTELKASMPKDQGVLNIKTEKTDNTPSEPVQIKTEVKKEENVVKSEQVTQENDEVKTESIAKQKDTKSESEDEQNVKVDVTSCSPSSLSILKPARKRGGAKREGVLVDCIDDGRVYSTEDTRKKIYLKKLLSQNVPVKKKAEKIKYPPTSRFYTRSKRCSLLVLPKHELRKLARHGGHDIVSGFNPNSKTNNAVWPYPCPRPYFKTCWLYRTIMFNTISAAALQLRILWACLKWDELTAKTAHLASKREVTTETELVTTETLECRTSGQFNEHTEYLIRKVVIPLDIPKQVREVTPIRSGLRKRKREEAPRNTAPQVSEVWVDESKLELVEIKQFHERVEREMQMQQAMKTRASTAFANKLLHNDSSHNRNINDKLRTQNSNTTENIKEQLEQSLRAQRIAYKRSSVSNDNNSSNKKLCMEVSNSQSPVTSSSTQRMKLVPGEGGRLRLMPNNKPLAQNPALLQSSPRVVNKPTTNTTTPSTRRIFMTKCPDGKTRLMTTPKTIITDANVINQNSMKIQSTNSQIVNSNNVTQQKLQCIKGEDGKIQFKGLLPGQQLIQLPDGKLHVTSYINPSPSRTVQIAKNTILANNNNLQKSGTQTIILNRGSQPIQQVLKPQTSQVVVSGGQLVNVSQGQQMILQHINPNKATIATINGQQVLIRSNTSTSANIINSGGQSIKFIRPQQAVQKVHQSIPPLSPRVTQTTGIVQDQLRSQNVPAPVVDEQEKLLLANQPPGTVIKCITAQVIQSPTHGNKIVLQGLQGNDFTPQQLQLVQQQVKQQLLKAQESSGTQGVLGPTKIYLAVQPPDSQLPAVQKTGIVAPVTAQPTIKIEPSSPKPSVPVPNNVSESLTQIKTEPPSKSPVNKIPVIKEEPIDNPNSFVVTPNYISQSIKNVLKNEDLNPETQEKLLQLQKYQEQQLRDPVPQPTVPASPVRKRPFDADDSSEFEPPKKSTERDNSGSLVSPEKSKLYQTLKQGDDLRKMQQLQSKLQNEIAANITVSSADSTTTSTNVTEKTTPVTPVSAQMTPPPQGSSKRKHASGPPTTIQTTPHANSNSKTSNLGPGRRRPMKVSPPAPNRNHSRPSSLTPAKKSSPKKSKKEKIMCLCRTPYDSSKFYVGCDMCQNWFHGSCVGITVQMSKRITEWYCPECKRSKDPEVLYCICRKPYDDQQFYICCDKCQDWFHGSCVGVLQCEGDKMDDYNCPRCMSNSEINFANLKPLNQQDNDDLLKLIKQIHSHKNAWPFMDPVDPHEAPDYYNVVKEPMDLNSIGKNVTDKTYKNLTEFIRDMIKVFDNCRYYNPRESQFYKCAEILEQFFVSKLKNLRDKFCEQYMKV